MGKIFHFLFNRITIVILLMLVQAAILVGSIWGLSQYFGYIYAGLLVLSIVAVFWIINTDINPAYKLAWTIIVLSFPIFGGPFYLLFGTRQANKNLSVRMNQEYEKIKGLLSQDPHIMDDLQEYGHNVSKQSEYILNASKFPVYQNTSTEFLSPGEVKFERLLTELKKAKHYIFMEYFIVQEGVMWNTILDILKQKVQEGVDVRLVYDDFGCLTLLPYGYHKTLQAMGIKCQVFNPLRPALSVSLNNRDHRKILVIDGHTAFTGGINLADEYINVIDKHGHWKDASIMLKGDAVWSLTLMFLSMWNYHVKTDENYDLYRPDIYQFGTIPTDGYVQPYGDSPLDSEQVGEMVYLNLINRAKKYVYISTPYLIVDNEIVTALILAAKSGVDVRIVTPRHWDKWYVHIVTQSYYKQLIEAGVKIYEYTPGFIHSKTFVADDETATVGTINLDFRSLYLHFECGVWMYRTSAVKQVYDDYLKILEASERITVEQCQKISWTKRFLRGIIRAFAPLM